MIKKFKKIRTYDVIKNSPIVVARFTNKPQLIFIEIEKKLESYRDK